MYTNVKKFTSLNVSKWILSSIHVGGVEESFFVLIPDPICVTGAGCWRRRR